MPISASSIVFRYSNVLSGSGNSDNVNPTSGSNSSTQCLGKYVSSAIWVGSTKNDLFDDITGNANTSRVVDYRCIFIHNSDPSLVLYNAVAWIYSNANGGASISIGVDPAGASPLTSSTAQATYIDTKYTAPSGVLFSSAATKDEGISLGNIAAGYCIALWIQRSAINGEPLDTDFFTLRIEGSTTA